jgi:diguanylate cyclase (GGDEF)-like protein
MVAAYRRVLERMERRRATGLAAAYEAARAIEQDAHDRVAAQRDVRSADYQTIAEMLRRVRNEHPPTRFLTTAVREADRFVIIVDPEEQREAWSPCGEEIVGAGGLAEAFSGEPLDSNVLYVDSFGVWVNAVAPVFAGGGEPVALVIADVPPEAPAADLDTLRSNVKQSFASLLHNTAERLSQARQDAITDYLTGLYNHRYLHERLDEELARAQDHGEKLSLLFIDIDQFKAFNDRYGHSMGDAALRSVAGIIEGHVRRMDIAARYGGEEFVVALASTGPAEAIAVADRIRRGVAELRIHPIDASLSVSVGVATFPDDAARKEELIDKADYAMYVAKRLGRDRVGSFSAGQLRLDLEASPLIPTSS